MQFAAAAHRRGQVYVYQEIENPKEFDEWIYLAGSIVDMHKNHFWQEYQMLWCKGAKPERSPKPEKPEAKPEATAPTTKPEATTPTVPSVPTAPTASHVDQVPHPSSFFGPSNTISKREAASEKLSERQLLGQATQNPFLCGNSYLDDLHVQDSFLTPRNTTANTGLRHVT
jgi:hypothetical protein